MAYNSKLLRSFFGGLIVALFGVAIALSAELQTIPPEKPMACPKTVLKTDRSAINAFVRCQASKYSIPYQVILAVIEIESNFNANARGADGEYGLMQLMPPTARMLGFNGEFVELTDPAINIELGTRYLAKGYRLAKTDLCTTVMKYRAGHGETRFSVKSVLYCKRARKILSDLGVQVTGVLPTPTFGFSNMNSNNTRGAKCVRRNFTPGPNYKKCVARRTISKSVTNLRRALFK